MCRQRRRRKGRGMGYSGIAEEGRRKGSKRRAKVEVSREEERVAVAARSIHGLLSKLILLALLVLGMLLASLPSIPPTLSLLEETMPSVVFNRVRPRGRGRVRVLVAVLVCGLAVPRGEG